MLEAVHIPGSSNLQADSLSRQYNRNLEWKAHPTVLKWISKSLFVLNIDLFVSRLISQRTVYVSWCLERGPWAVDGFSFCWREFTLYFPSFPFVWQNPNEAQGGGSFRCSSHSTMMANSTLVFTAPPIIGPVSYPSAPEGRTPNLASGRFSTPSQRCNA